jgi:HlyD family secretion protein
MNRNYFYIIIAVAVGSLFLIFSSLWKDINSPITKDTVDTYAKVPFKSYISGTGVVEASGGNILISSPLNRVIETVFVKPGEKVKKGDVLFRLDNRDLQASLMLEEASYNSAVAKLKKLESTPRPEDLASAEADYMTSKAQFDLAKKQYEMVQGLQDPRAISQEEKDRRYYNYQQAEAKMQKMKADLDKVKGGPWKPDLAIARLEVDQAKANLNKIKAQIQETIVKSPIDGTILQMKIHPGELPPSDSRTPMIILGNIDDLNLRVSINQFDVPHFDPKGSAVVFVQGDSTVQLPLELVRVEPLLVAKQNLTNDISEKIDTKVLQIIYRIKNDKYPLYVGQQMDVFIKTQPRS